MDWVEEKIYVNTDECSPWGEPRAQHLTMIRADGPALVSSNLPPVRLQRQQQFNNIIRKCKKAKMGRVVLPLVWVRWLFVIVNSWSSQHRQSLQQLPLQARLPTTAAIINGSLASGNHGDGGVESEREEVFNCWRYWSRNDGIIVRLSMEARPHSPTPARRASTRSLGCGGGGGLAVPVLHHEVAYILFTECGVEVERGRRHAVMGGTGHREVAGTAAVAVVTIDDVGLL